MPTAPSSRSSSSPSPDPLLAGQGTFVTCKYPPWYLRGPGSRPLLVIAINSAAALAARLGGHVRLDWPLLGVFIVAALAGTLAGNRVASRVDASRLTAAFAILLVAVAAYSLARSLPGLV
jgi:Sulfite exporter TauE/SafE